MSEMEAVLERTERLQSQVEELRQALERVREELESQRASLASRLGQEPASAETAERRSLPRHWGNPIPIVISHPQGTPATFQGWVVDRSPEGLCVVAEKEVTAGAQVRVQPTFADAHWFPIEVRHCHAERNVWILGCRFLHSLSWNDLALFG